MPKGLIRLLAFFGKEINEVRRQPRLVLSLIFGPFLVLLLFGVGYQDTRPRLRTALVVPQERINDPRMAELRKTIDLNFEVVNVGSDRAAALDELRRGAVEVVEIMPPELEERVLRGEQSAVEFKYSAIDPIREQWIQYLSYAQINELNRAIVTEATRQLQQEARPARGDLADVRQRLDMLDSGLTAARRDETRESIRRLRGTLDVLSGGPLLLAGGDRGVNRTEIRQLRDDLDILDRSLESGTIDQQRERIATTRQRIEALDQALTRFSEAPAEALVSPLQQRYENIRGQPYDLMTFYAPGVLALIIQHIAVTLGALSLVRERLLGAMEFYGVAPVSMLQVLLGKYLAYTLFIAIIAGVLLTLMLALPVPFLGDIFAFIGLLALFTLAALGVGFLISALSTSDGQAIQLAMLVLLLSIFFSGFFLPLENFLAPVRLVGEALPLTHAIRSFQAIMLRGELPDTLTWSALGTIAAAMFIGVVLIWRRQFRRVG